MDNSLSLALALSAIVGQTKALRDIADARDISSERALVKAFEKNLLMSIRETVAGNDLVLEQVLRAVVDGNAQVVQQLAELQSDIQRSAAPVMQSLLGLPPAAAKAALDQRMLILREMVARGCEEVWTHRLSTRADRNIELICIGGGKPGELEVPEPEHVLEDLQALADDRLLDFIRSDGNHNRQYRITRAGRARGEAASGD